MLVGVGIDLIEVSRIRHSIEVFGKRFLHRVFTTVEIQYAESKANRWERYAARFAAKEAGMKALGTGWAGGVSWRDLEVINEASGRPELQLSGAAGHLAAEKSVRRIWLSLSHTRLHAIAQVVLET
jgi:holo-[acyl-carrier protein] synthase